MIGQPGIVFFVALKLLFLVSLNRTGYCFYLLIPVKNSAYNKKIATLLDLLTVNRVKITLA